MQHARTMLRVTHPSLRPLMVRTRVSICVAASLERGVHVASQHKDDHSHRVFERYCLSIGRIELNHAIPLSIRYHLRLRDSVTHTTSLRDELASATIDKQHRFVLFESIV